MNLSLLKYAMAEIKFLKSFKDLNIFFNQKLPFFLPRFKENIIRETEVPPSLQLEPTNHCNLSCISCPRDRITREKGFMDFTLFKKIVDDANQSGVKRIHLYLHGEPLLHPKVSEMIGYIKKGGLGITLTTNGMPLNPSKIENILYSGVDSGDYFTFSVLGYSKEIHEKIMVGVNHKKVLENITDFLRLRKLKKVNGPIIETIFYSMPENQTEENEFLRYWQGVTDHVKVVDSISKLFQNPVNESNYLPERQISCPNLWERLTVYWNGDATLCCQDINGDYVMGNLKENSIREIWNSDRLLAIRGFHKSGKLKYVKICRYCDM